MLVTRTVSNVGDPLVSPGGVVLAGVKVRFVLVDATGKSTDAWDAETGEIVRGAVEATTDALGEFTVALWPNDRGTTVTQYLCFIGAQTVNNFRASLPSGVGSLSFISFSANGAVLSATPVGVAVPNPFTSGALDGYVPRYNATTGAIEWVAQTAICTGSLEPMLASSINGTADFMVTSSGDIYQGLGA